MPGGWVAGVHRLSMAPQIVQRNMRSVKSVGLELSMSAKKALKNFYPVDLLDRPFSFAVHDSPHLTASTGHYVSC